VKTTEALQNEWSREVSAATDIKRLADSQSRRMTMPEVERVNALLDKADALHAEMRILRAPSLARGPVLNAVRAGWQGGTGGTARFRDLGEFTACVRATRVGNRIVDRRLDVLNAAATTYGQEAVGADGGYLVPPDFKTEILQKCINEKSLLARTDQRTTTSNSITLPAAEDEPWSSSGAAAVWAGEGTVPAQKKLKLNGATVHLQKLMAIVPVTDEMVEDSAQLGQQLLVVVPPKFDYALNNAIVNGAGAGQLTGLLKSKALITQDPEPGQTAATVNYANVSKMRSRMPQANRANAVWIANADLEPQFESMVIPNTNFPAYLHAGALNDSPFDLLLGRPVIYTEACPLPGAVGDLLLADMSQYLSAVKVGILRMDFSMHVYFRPGRQRLQVRCARRRAALVEGPDHARDFSTSPERVRRARRSVARFSEGAHGPRWVQP
jgi:HK97 family phage major capsid protein